ncbi:MAG: hypothetical protein LBG87_06285 [Spirochaetaceae bacterium]|nr:hypothetical protein [Spirochaetaceae bacterium]
MSYQQNYHTAVPYSGSTSVSYPASEKGGSMSVSYSGKAPVDVTILVNTTPFDGSVNHCNGSIDLLTGAVIAMNAAQCATIEETGRQVSKAVIDGFFGVIKSELSQQMQALDSAVKAGLGLIQQEAQAVDAQRSVMETDYNRISSRYVTLFADLDNECYKRIYALDKQSFMLAQKVREELLSETSRNNAALNLIGNAEESASKLSITVSRINRKAQEVLQSLREYIDQEKTMAQLLAVALKNEPLEQPVVVHCPVIVSEAALLENPILAYAAYAPDYLDGAHKQELMQKVLAQVSADAGNGIAAPDKEAVGKEFIAVAEKAFQDKDSAVDKRVYRTMLALWQNECEKRSAVSIDKPEL